MRKAKVVWHKDDDAVSPVIGTILMVAITVVLAAVLVREAARAMRRGKVGEVSSSGAGSALGDPEALLKRRLPSEGK